MSFADPLWLQVGAALLLVVALAAWSHSWRRRRLARYLGGQTAAGRLSGSNLYRLRFERVLLLGVVVMALAAAAAGPSWNVPPPAPPPPPPTRSVVIAVDVSASMQATDAAPNRLGSAVQLVDQLLAALEDDRVGLILFAGTPYPLAPPTHDHRALRYMLRGVTPTIASAHDPGSLPSAAVGEAAAMLERWAASDDERRIILISDGEAGEPVGAIETAARSAAGAAIDVHVIGMGTAEGSGFFMPPAQYQLGGRVMNESGAPAISRLRETTLSRAAEAGSGLYAPADEPASIAALTNAVTSRSVTTLAAEQPTEPVEAPVWTRQDPIVWFISVALLVLILESLLDVRLPGRALALVRRTA
jgi:Ca-activated chloride channel homolog